jgi:polar amino acid transport system substrate-binding protein
MFIWSKQLAPIISSKNSDVKSGQLEDYSGIIVDVLGSLPEADRPHVNVILSSRKRGEKELYEGNIDFTILSPKWLESPEKLIFSSPIYVHKEFLYDKKAIPNKPLKDLVEGKRICVRTSYKYPGVSQYFESGLATRVDTDDEFGQFKLLFRGRCDFVLTNEFAANKVLKLSEWGGLVSVSDIIIDKVGYTLAFHPKHQKFVDKLNKHIAKLIESGQLGEIINRQTQY